MWFLMGKVHSLQNFMLKANFLNGICQVIKCTNENFCTNGLEWTPGLFLTMQCHKTYRGARSETLVFVLGVRPQGKGGNVNMQPHEKKPIPLTIQSLKQCF